jgi:hypothetical protein
MSRYFLGIVSPTEARRHSCATAIYHPFLHPIVRMQTVGGTVREGLPKRPLNCKEYVSYFRQRHICEGTLFMPTSLAQKLRILEGCHVALLNAPDGYARMLDPLPSGVEITTSGGDRYDVTLLFARDHAELERLAPTAIAATRNGGVLWVAWPKGGAKTKGAITRDTLWPVLATLGWGPVSNVALDETWSALRLRPEAEVTRSSKSFGGRDNTSDQ